MLILLVAFTSFIFGQDSAGTVTDIDGNIYKTIKIGSQIWMAENLKVVNYRNGDPIPNITSNSEWEGLSTGAYCVYDNEDSYTDTYGYLYNWYVVTDNRNIAPDGWHVPTDKEWEQLDMYLGISRLDMFFNGSSWIGVDEGGKMKEVGTTHWNNPNTGATNESGLSARPGGMRGDNGYYDYIGTRAYFWSTSKVDNLLGPHAYFWSTSKADYNLAWFHMLSSTSSWIYRHYHFKSCGFSVRCVRD